MPISHRVLAFLRGHLILLVRVGAKSYLKDGMMTGGYASLALPAEYRNSGVMTFMIDRDGVVYQKDLGETSVEAAKAITAFDPDASWGEIEE